MRFLLLFLLSTPAYALDCYQVADIAVLTQSLRTENNVTLDSFNQEITNRYQNVMDAETLDSVLNIGKSVFTQVPVDQEPSTVGVSYFKQCRLTQVSY